MPSLNDPILSVRNLTTRLLVGGIPYPVVDQLSFDLHKGETLAIVGESGCGKSMTALSILRILPQPPALPSEGEVLYNGENLLTLSEKSMRHIRGAKISMIFQNPMSALNPVYTIGEQLFEVAYIHLGLSQEAATAQVLKALEDVHLPHPKDRLREYPHQLSGGMLQRVMIAMALLCEPDVLIADEPTTALDVTIQAQILALLKELQSEKGMAILLITHDMGVVAETAHRVIVMYASQKIEEGTLDAIFRRPSHPYTQGLFQSRPNRPIHQGHFPTIKGSVPSLTQLPSGCHFHPRCPYQMSICGKGKVASFPLPTPEHNVSCWLFDPHLEAKMRSW